MNSYDRAINKARINREKKASAPDQVIQRLAHVITREQIKDFKNPIIDELDAAIAKNKTNV